MQISRLQKLLPEKYGCIPIAIPVLLIYKAKRHVLQWICACTICYTSKMFAMVNIFNIFEIQEQAP